MITVFVTISLLTSTASSAYVWVPSATEPNIEYYYSAKCIGFSLSAGTTVCQNIFPTAVLASVTNAVVQAHIAANVIDGSPSGGVCSDQYGKIGTGGTYINKTIGSGGTVSWLNGDAETSDLVHYTGTPYEALPTWPSLCLSTVPGEYGDAMDCDWTADSAYYGVAVLCQRNILDTLPPSASPITIAPTHYPTINPSKTPTEPTPSPTTNPTPTENPSSVPTKCPTAAPTTISTKEPTNNPSNDPTLIPTENPTKAPTNTPTKSPTTVRNGFQFHCRYNDMEMNYYVIYITLSRYASIMTDAILSAIENVTDFTTNYNETESNSYLHWKRAGIYGFKICSVFTDIELDNECTEYDYDSGDNDDDDDDVDADYTAFGVFGIVVDEELDRYQQYLISAIESETFKIAFNYTMNVELRRNLLSDEFRAVVIQVLTPQNATEEDANDSTENQITNTNASIATTAIIVIVVVLLLIIIGMSGYFVYYTKFQSLERHYDQNRGKPGIYDIHQQMNDDDDIAKCKMVERLLDLMISYETWNEFPDGNLKWNSIADLFKHYDLVQIIDDYNHYLSNHEDDKGREYMNECLLLRINDLCRKNHDDDDIGNDRKYLMSTNDVESQDVFKLEMVDKMHIYFFHSEAKSKEDEKGKEEPQLQEEIEQIDDDIFAMSLGENELNQMLDEESVQNGDQDSKEAIKYNNNDDDIVDIINQSTGFGNQELMDEDNDNDGIVLPCIQTNTLVDGEIQ